MLTRSTDNQLRQFRSFRKVKTSQFYAFNYNSQGKYVNKSLSKLLRSKLAEVI